MTKDGASEVLALFMMPIFVGFYFALIWPFTWLMPKIWPRKEAGSSVYPNL
jgi:hypothetical protein